MADPAFFYAALRSRCFGTLSSVAGPPRATHIPFVVKEHEGERGVLEGHVARADALSRAVDSGARMLATFARPAAYVSPVWYAAPGFPTYCYVAVHALGTVLALDEVDTRRHLRELMAAHGERFPAEGHAPTTPTGSLDSLLPGIAAFRLEVERLQGKARLMQHRSAEDRTRVIAGLRARADGDDLEVADLMERFAYVTDAPTPLLPEMDRGGPAIQDDDNWTL